MRGKKTGRTVLRQSSPWGWNQNLELQWTSGEQGINKEGEQWSAARGMLWTRKPTQLLASVYVRNNEYAVYTQGLYGMTKEQEKSLEEHLQNMGFTKRKQHDGI